MGVIRNLGLRGGEHRDPSEAVHDVVDVYVKPIAKAIMGFIAPGAVIVGSAVLPMSDGGQAITAAEWITAAVACIVTSAGVYAVPNRPTRPTTKVPPVDRP